jgi:hypothetical protein
VPISLSTEVGIGRALSKPGGHNDAMGEKKDGLNGIGVDCSMDADSRCSGYCCTVRCCMADGAIRRFYE